MVVLSHQFWTRQFGGDAAIVGQALTLNGRPHTVVGVVSPAIEFGNLSDIDVWVPLTVDRAAPRDRRIYRITGRLAPGVTIQAGLDSHGRFLGAADVFRTLPVALLADDESRQALEEAAAAAGPNWSRPRRVVGRRRWRDAPTAL